MGSFSLRVDTLDQDLGNHHTIEGKAGSRYAKGGRNCFLRQMHRSPGPSYQNGGLPRKIQRHPIPFLACLSFNRRTGRGKKKRAKRSLWRPFSPCQAVSRERCRRPPTQFRTAILTGWGQSDGDKGLKPVDDRFKRWLPPRSPHGTLEPGVVLERFRRDGKVVSHDGCRHEKTVVCERRDLQKIPFQCPAPGFRREVFPNPCPLKL